MGVDYKDYEKLSKCYEESLRDYGELSSEYADLLRRHKRLVDFCYELLEKYEISSQVHDKIMEVLEEDLGFKDFKLKPLKLL